MQQGSVQQGLSSVAVLIPAWQPETVLIALTEELMSAGFGAVIAVDDGSGSAFEGVFARLRLRGVHVLRHAVNLGKGRALKTGFNYLLTDKPELRGVVTADADGQHAVADIVRVALRLIEDDTQPVLGVRQFSGAVPLRSRFGNRLTRGLFGFLTGVKLGDTQTGLRGLPMALLPGLVALDGEHYEYEMTMLAHLCRDGRRPVEAPIETIYLEDNRGSHFDPLRDSARIYLALARSSLSSIFHRSRAV
ncbi:Glycosyl transferase family 2 [Granulicella rosea]|uniref:Glycosyl transferase family 2 n=1 Tax=Granulicella rosea TaxID=474952 RepID=A0A239DU43_9BACT|nr:glycosyltransferase family 2 protein [Granulicella rosea]SNS36135.1 Glycosyl transferase family 2 [Granulicella rosea]